MSNIFRGISAKSYHLQKSSINKVVKRVLFGKLTFLAKGYFAALLKNSFT